MCKKDINIKLFPAQNGDCILIKLSDKYILIDGGYINTYNNYLKPELIKLSKQGFILSHVIVSHIDADHISGIIKLLEENENNAIISIENIWHNSYRHLNNLAANSNIPIFSGKKVESFTIKSYLKEKIKEEKVISAEQGSSLGALILKGDYKWNNEFDNEFISVNKKQIIQLDSNITIRLLSPDEDKLKALKKYWLKELFKKGYITSEKTSNNYDDAFEFLIAQEKEKKIINLKDISHSAIDLEKLAKTTFKEDTSFSNGSSISFVLEYFGKKLLFLADSHPSLIENSIKYHYKDEVFPIKFDLIKLSHHGCVSNTSHELLSIIDSRKYVFSTDGSQFSHPNIETISRIITRKTEFTRELYFNYKLDILEKLNNKQLKEKYSYSIITPSIDAPVKIVL